MKPRKFYYEETHYFGSVYLIEWNSQTGLELQDTSPCIPFSVHASTILQPNDDDWRKVETSIKALALMPKEPEVPSCDGFEVHCHITFRNRLLKFLIINPEFRGFTELRDLLNQFTICSDYPNGLLETDL